MPFEQPNQNPPQDKPTVPDILDLDNSETSRSRRRSTQEDFVPLRDVVAKAQKAQASGAADAGTARPRAEVAEELEWPKP